jgi:aryl-alcohol dehydrogenase-like predicted oxidoreductase
MKLAIGTVQFGLKYGVANTSGGDGRLQAPSILEFARASGIDTLDTAIDYGDSESVLGQIGVESWRVVSKLPAVPDGCSNIPEWVRGQTLASLDRLGMSQLHGLLLHRPSQLLEGIGPILYDSLLSLKSEGLIKKVGVSVYRVQELDRIFDTFAFDMVQAPLNLFDRHLIESGWGSILKQAGVEVHTRSTFLQGLLLLPADQRPPKFKRWDEIWRKWTHWLAETGMTPLEACIRYALSQDLVDRVVVGVDTYGQLQEIVGAASGSFPSLPIFDIAGHDPLIDPTKWGEI